MLTRSRVIAGASGLAGEPPDEPLPAGIPQWLRYEMAADIETELLRDMNLSAQNRTMASYPIRLNAGEREFSLTQAGLENPVFIALGRDGAPNEIPQPVEITNLSNIYDDARANRRSVAFFADKPQRGMLSWIPQNGETLTVWYDRSPNTDPSAETSTFTIQNGYVPLLKHRLAAWMLELLGKPIGAMLAASIQRGMDQWQSFVSRERQEGLVEKTTYRGSRNTGGSVYDTWPARINFE
nr:hypothetical protein [uncultured bacterium]